jgi:hypothetical protein
MKFQCKFEAEDYVEAYKTYAKRGSRRWLTRYLWALAILLFLIGALGSFGPKSSPLSALPLFLFSAFLIFYATAVWRRAGRRAFSGRPELAQEYAVDIDDSGIAFSGSISQMHWTWAAFTKFGEADKLFLAYLSPCAFVILPKRILGPEQAGQLRELLRQKLPNG